MATNVWSDVWNLHSVNLVVPTHHVVEAVFPVHGYQWEACFIYKKKSRVAINHLLYSWLFSVLQYRLEDAKDEMIRLEELNQAKKEIEKTERPKELNQNMFRVI